MKNDMLKESIELEADLACATSFIERIERPIVTIMGSARVAADDILYKHAQETAQHIGEKGFNIASGGGKGIMDAAHKGAVAAGVKSYAIRIRDLAFKSTDSQEEAVSDFDDELMLHSMFFPRTLLFEKISAGMLLYPGGFGTLEEFMKLGMYRQYNPMTKKTIICVEVKNENNQYYWKDFTDPLREHAVKRGFMDENDFNFAYKIELDSFASSRTIAQLFKDGINF